MIWFVAFPVLSSEKLDVSLLASQGKILLAPYTEVFEDPDSSLTFEAMRHQAGDIEFRPLGNNRTNQGFTDSAYWYRLTFDNAGNPSPLDGYLEVAYPLLDTIDFFLMDSQGELAEQYTTGDHLPFHHRPIAHPNFVIPLHFQEGNAYTLYLRVKTQSAMDVPLTLWREDSFETQNIATLIFFSSMISIIAILAMHNLLVYWSIRDVCFLYAAVCLFSFVCVQSVLTGFGYAYFWPNSPVWNEKSLLLSANLALSMLLLFVRDFLCTQTNLPKLYPLYNLLAGICLLGLPAAVIVPYDLMIRFTVVNVVLVPTISYASGLYLLTKGLRSAKMLVAILSVFLIGSVDLALSKFGVTGRESFSEYSIHVGAILGALLLSFALADRLKREEKARHSAQLETRNTLGKYRQLYENSLEGMFRLDGSGYLEACNPSFIHLMGAETEQQLDPYRHLISQLIPSDPEANRLFRQSLRQQGHIFGFEARCKRIDQSEFWAAIFIRHLDSESGQSVLEGSLVDITELKENQQRLDYLDTHDPLTGLMNRSEFDKKLSKACLQSRSQDSEHSLLYIDLDQFKIINEACGHAAGDTLLNQLASLMRRSIREQDCIARLGGDEFAVLLLQCGLDRAEAVAQKIRKAILDYPFSWNSHSYGVSASIGIVAITRKHSDVEEIFSLADTACFAAKEAGRNRVMIHNPEASAIARHQSQMRIVSHLREAIKQDKLVLFAQGIKPLQRSSQGLRFEVLVRMAHDGEIIPPDQFLSAAERFNVIADMDRWVVEAFFSWLQKRPESLAALEQANINLSSQTISHEDLGAFIVDCYRKYQIPPEKICLEITESAAISNLAQTRSFMDALKAKGFKFALDDFGCGFSSYDYLRRLPFDSVKIDGSFIRNITRNPIDHSMVKSITDIGHIMGLTVVGEFVENREILETLTTLKVDYGQGYFIDKPQSLDCL